MPLTPTFTAVQSLSSLREIVLTDTSTGSDGTITSRRVYLATHAGTYLTPTGTTTDYIVWPYADSTIEIDVLDKDYSLDVKVDFMAGASVVVTKTVLTLFTGYSDSYLLDLTMAIASNARLMNNANFWENKFKLRCLVDDATQANANGDQSIAQLCLNKATELTTNNAYFF